MGNSDLSERMPAMLRREFLGVELWSYIGILGLIFIALLTQRLVVYLVGTWVRRLVGMTRFRYLERAMHKADRPIGGLVMALVFHIGFPVLLFPARVDRLCGIAVEALAAFSGVWLAYRLIDVLGEGEGESLRRAERRAATAALDRSAAHGT